MAELSRRPHGRDGLTALLAGPPAGPSAWLRRRLRRYSELWCPVSHRARSSRSQLHRRRGAQHAEQALLDARYLGIRGRRPRGRRGAQHYRPNVGVAPQTFVQRAAGSRRLADDAYRGDPRPSSGQARCAAPRAAGGGLRARRRPATFFLWLALPDGADDRPGRSSSLLTPGSFFGAGGAGHVRIALVPTLADCRRAAELIESWAMSTTGLSALSATSTSSLPGGRPRRRGRPAGRGGHGSTTAGCASRPRRPGWRVNEWAKKAILLSFRTRAMETIELGPYEYHDKMPLKGGWAARGVLPPRRPSATARAVRHALLRQRRRGVGDDASIPGRPSARARRWASKSTSRAASASAACSSRCRPSPSSRTARSSARAASAVRVGSEAVLGAKRRPDRVDADHRRPRRGARRAARRGAAAGDRHPGHARSASRPADIASPARSSSASARPHGKTSLTARRRCATMRSACRPVPREDRHRPAGEVHVQVLADVDLELAAAVTARRRRAGVGDRRAAAPVPLERVSPTPRSKSARG